jgi:DNA-directed RNA polymerase beta subunit
MYSGQNAIVAVAIYTGYNQEDSIIMNQSSLDRGMFRTTHYRTVTTEERTDTETFGKPSELESTGSLARSVEKLDEDGLPGVGLSLGVGDVIVGKVCKSQSAFDSNARLTDRSQRLKHHEKGRVAQVMLVENEEGQRIAKVKLRESRMPQVGDKFSSMHGQKGVIGMVFTQEDLCFTNEGIVPDIIINPHAFPSRQTLGQMWESNQGKTVAKTGERQYATPFNQLSTVETMLDSLHK